MRNSLFYGDNLEILREHFADESVDLVYLDPPFNSNANYNVLFREQSGEESPAQIQAFSDTWRWTQESERTYESEIILNPATPLRVKDLVSALRQSIGRNDVMAYVVMMTPRLVELHRVMAPTASIYLHCDPTAGHLLRILMDSIFGPANFRNAITWKRTSAHSDAKRFGRNTDTIWFYTKGDEWTWNQQFGDYDSAYLKSHYRYETDDGRRYRTDNLTAGGLTGGGYEYEWNGVERVWRLPRESMQRLHDDGRIRYTRNGVAEYIRYLDESQGMPLQSLWDDIAPINSQARERLGFQTQKPQALLERIIGSSSNEGDLVLDPFCGCGTTVAAAEKLGRKWAGVDITHLAVALMKHRLHNSFDIEPGRDFDVVGEPVDLGGAQALAEQDRFQFEYWALSLVGARPVGDNRRGSDHGIDGVLHFVNGPRRATKRAIVQVKSGRVGVGQVRDLVGTLDRENAEIGLFVTLNPPTAPMQREAIAAGYWHSEIWQRSYPRVQIRTIQELLDGNGFELPPGPSMLGDGRRLEQPGPPQGQLDACR